MSNDTPNDYHARIRVLEEWRMETRELLHQINAKLDLLATSITKASATPHCPAPGSCIEIRKEIATLREEHSETMERVFRLEKAQAWALGAIATVAVGWSVVTVILPLVVK